MPGLVGDIFVYVYIDIYMIAYIQVLPHSSTYLAQGVRHLASQVTI
jgi:hypothetical protein